MELLTILYAMLAALTGVTVGDASSARQPLVASAQAERVEVAVATVRTLAQTATGFGCASSHAVRRQRITGAQAVAIMLRSVQRVAFVVLGRRHL